jgi:hypothetical protein
MTRIVVGIIKIDERISMIDERVSSSQQIQHMILAIQLAFFGGSFMTARIMEII